MQLIPLKPARVPTSSKCLTAGWGDVGDNKTLPARLQEVNVTILSQQSCRTRWRLVPIARTMVCGVGETDFQGICSVRSFGLSIHQVWREFKGCTCKYCGFRLLDHLRCDIIPTSVPLSYNNPSCWLLLPRRLKWQRFNFHLCLLIKCESYLSG